MTDNNLSIGANGIICGSFPEIMSYEDMTWRKLSMSACRELVARIKRGVNKLFRVTK